MQATTHTSIETQHRSTLAGLSIVIGAGMVLAILGGMAGGMVQHWKGGVAMLILADIPICTLGTGLAVASLIWRKENKQLAQGALWLNGMLAFFGFPLMIYWLLAMA